MNQFARVESTLLVVCAGVAFGVVAMTGVVAAVVFPTVRDLGPVLPDHATYTGPHWSLVAGVVAEGVFRIGFVVVGAALGGALLSVIALAVQRGERRLPVVRLALLVVTLGLFLTHAAWLQPRMDRAATEYRDAAGLGDNAAASEAKARFDAMHPTASKLIGATTIAAPLLFVGSAWAATQSGASPSHPGHKDER
ncbi:MAG: hypothetical protein ACF8LK_02175 [Phycisphaerales bacterium JB041]